MTSKAPIYDPNKAAEQRARRAFEVLMTLPEWARQFGEAVVLPNWEAGFAEGVRTKKQAEKK